MLCSCSSICQRSKLPGASRTFCHFLDLSGTRFQDYSGLFLTILWNFTGSWSELGTQRSRVEHDPSRSAVVALRLTSVFSTKAPLRLDSGADECFCHVTVSYPISPDGTLHMSAREDYVSDRVARDFSSSATIGRNISLPDK